MQANLMEQFNQAESTFRGAATLVRETPSEEFRRAAVLAYHRLRKTWLALQATTRKALAVRDARNLNLFKELVTDRASTLAAQQAAQHVRELLEVAAASESTAVRGAMVAAGIYYVYIQLAYAWFSTADYHELHRVETDARMQLRDLEVI